MRTTLLERFALLAFLITGLVLPAISMAQANLDCDSPNRNSRNWQLVIIVVGNAPSDVMRGNEIANRQYVCRGDTVTWRIPARAFSLSFADDSLFGQAELASGNGNSISVVVSSDAERGREYTYDIRLANGRALDPQIIVD